MSSPSQVGIGKVTQSTASCRLLDAWHFHQNINNSKARPLFAHSSIRFEFHSRFAPPKVNTSDNVSGRMD